MAGLVLSVIEGGHLRHIGHDAIVVRLLAAGAVVDQPDIVGRTARIRGVRPSLSARSISAPPASR